MLIVDAHEDLAYNIKTFNRNYALSAQEIRRRELGTQVPIRNGDTLLGWPEYQQGKVAVVFATLFAAPKRAQVADWDIQCYTNPQEAHDLYREQVDLYYRLVEKNPDKFRLIHTQKDLQEVLSQWEEAISQPEANEEESPVEEKERDNQESEPEKGNPVGLVMLMEGAEGVRHPGELEEWWELGVRIIGPAWRGTRFCGGTREPGPLTGEGYALLEGMAQTGFALDISHMDEEAVLQALDFYPGVILASHSNAAALLKGVETNRLLSDRVIQGIIERDGVVGIVLPNSFIYPNWTIKDGREKVSLDRVVAQIDYVCQMAGDAQHVGIGTDFDGGFGVQTVPYEMDTIADLQKLIPLLSEKGYADEDIAAIMGENWLNRLKRVLLEA